MIFAKLFKFEIYRYTNNGISIVVKTQSSRKPSRELERGCAMTSDNSIFIGGKPFMNYVTGVVMQFTTKNAQEVIVKARGKFISRAVDVTEVASKRFLEGQIEIKDIKVDSEEFQNKEGRTVRVSTIEIALKKK
jgi:DNA-binding protein